MCLKEKQNGATLVWKRTNGPRKREVHKSGITICRQIPCTYQKPPLNKYCCNQEPLPPRIGYFPSRVTSTAGLISTARVSCGRKRRNQHFPQPKHFQIETVQKRRYNYSGILALLTSVYDSLFFTNKCQYHASPDLLSVLHCLNTLLLVCTTHRRRYMCSSFGSVWYGFAPWLP